jgi:hypothetical protein
VVFAVPGLNFGAGELEGLTGLDDGVFRLELALVGTGLLALIGLDLPGADLLEAAFIEADELEGLVFAAGLAVTLGLLEGFAVAFRGADAGLGF